MRIKDPLYGYIELAPRYSAIIDTPEFQRLRNIRQTGYQSLYPSALHNRFVHSLGVFHLGNKAYECFQKNVPKEMEKILTPIKETFLLACLLHDVGHSPFSHTGEKFYSMGIDFISTLSNQVNDSNFSKDIKMGGYGKEHEAMSALIGSRLCKNIPSFDTDLFVRAIIGLKYKNNINDMNIVVKNALIEMLNGELIDVDKLDYLVRDAYVTGYNNVSLDIDRLLSGYTVIQEGTSYKTGYKRSALSVIENVIYANDLERRWIQNNPTILYDSRIVEYCIRQFDSYKTFQCKNLNTIFCQESLSPEGINDASLKLLCDDDIITYAKNIDNSEACKHLFFRNLRLKPLWKTEADYLCKLDCLSPLVRRHFIEDITALEETVDAKGLFLFIDDDLMKYLENQIDQAKNDEDSEYAKISSENYHKMLHICKCFKDFSTYFSPEMDFKFLVICADKFTSNFRKLDSSKIFIELSSNNVKPLKELKSLTVAKITEEDERKEKLFYIYTTSANLKHPKITNLLKFINQNYEEIK